LNFVVLKPAGKEIFLQVFFIPTYIRFLFLAGENQKKSGQPLQQYEKFYEVYDIKPGDRMYRSPEERCRVW